MKNSKSLDDWAKNGNSSPFFLVIADWCLIFYWVNLVDHPLHNREHNHLLIILDCSFPSVFYLPSTLYKLLLIQDVWYLTLRSEIISLRSDRDKLALESNFARERLESFMKEFEHQVIIFFEKISLLCVYVCVGFSSLPPHDFVPFIIFHAWRCISCLICGVTCDV